jgi:hypothetical protein
MTPSRCAAAVLALSAFALGACSKTDLGATCKMTKPCGDGGVCAIAPDQVANTAVDYVALGSAECDDLVCLRTARSNNPPNTATEAFGYCTTPCINADNCSPDFQGHSGNLNCDRLLLDQAFLDALMQQDPATYRRVFGNGASSTYCVLPRGDAGP